MKKALSIIVIMLILGLYIPAYGASEQLYVALSGNHDIAAELNLIISHPDGGYVFCLRNDYASAIDDPAGFTFPSFLTVTANPGAQWYIDPSSAKDGDTGYIEYSDGSKTYSIKVNCMATGPTNAIQDYKGPFDYTPAASQIKSTGKLYMGLATSNKLLDRFSIEVNSYTNGECFYTDSAGTCQVTDCTKVSIPSSIVAEYGEGSRWALDGSQAKPGDSGNITFFDESTGTLYSLPVSCDPGLPCKGPFDYTPDASQIKSTGKLYMGLDTSSKPLDKFSIEANSYTNGECFYTDSAGTCQVTDYTKVNIPSFIVAECCEGSRWVLDGAKAKVGDSGNITYFDESTGTLYSLPVKCNRVYSGTSQRPSGIDSDYKLYYRLAWESDSVIQYGESILPLDGAVFDPDWYALDLYFYDRIDDRYVSVQEATGGKSVPKELDSAEGSITQAPDSGNGKVAEFSGVVISGKEYPNLIYFNTVGEGYITFNYKGVTSKFRIGSGNTQSTPIQTYCSDVSESVWYHDAVLWGYESGVVESTGDKFNPQSSNKRSTLVCWFYKAAGEPEVSAADIETAKAKFRDIGNDEETITAVAWALANGITSGTSETTFSPDGYVNRAQMVQFLYNFNKATDTATDSKFNDVPSNAWYAAAVSWAFRNDITSGTSDTTFTPNAEVTRAMNIQFLYNQFK